MYKLYGKCLTANRKCWLSLSHRAIRNVWNPHLSHWNTDTFPVQHTEGLALCCWHTMACHHTHKTSLTLIPVMRHDQVPKSTTPANVGIYTILMDINNALKCIVHNVYKTYSAYFTVGMCNVVLCSYNASQWGVMVFGYQCSSKYILCYVEESHPGLE